MTRREIISMLVYFVLGFSSPFWGHFVNRDLFSSSFLVALTFCGAGLIILVSTSKSADDNANFVGLWIIFMIIGVVFVCFVVGPYGCDDSVKSYNSNHQDVREMTYSTCFDRFSGKIIRNCYWLWPWRLISWVEPISLEEKMDIEVKSQTGIVYGEMTIEPVLYYDFNAFTPQQLRSMYPSVFKTEKQVKTQISKIAALSWSKYLGTKYPLLRPLNTSFRFSSQVDPEIEKMRSELIKDNVGKELLPGIRIRSLFFPTDKTS